MAILAFNFKKDLEQAVSNVRFQLLRYVKIHFK